MDPRDTSVDGDDGNIRHPVRQEYSVLQLHDGPTHMLVHWDWAKAQGTASKGPDIDSIIDQIEDRLGRIENILRQLPALIKQASSSTSHTPDPSSSSALFFDKPLPNPQQSQHAATPATGTSPASLPAADRHAAEAVTKMDSDADEAETDAEAPFEGDSSMTAHTAFASEFLHLAVGRTSLEPGHAHVMDNPSLHSALSSLQQIVHMQKRGSTTADIRFLNQKFLPPGGLRELPLPPLNVVVGILRELKGNNAHQYIPVTFTLMCSFLGVDEFTEHCRRVYFATEDYSQADYIITVAGLFYVFEERAFSSSDSGGGAHTNEEYERYYHMCRVNLEAALSQFNLLQTPKRENVEALLLGTTYAIELAKPSLAWQLSSAACQLCLTMGYHRAGAEAAGRRSASIDRGGRRSSSNDGRGMSVGSSSIGDDHHGASSSKRQVLFLFAYTLDKGLALRLGRASVLRDEEITVPRQLGRISEYDEYRDTINMWARHAHVQGRIYDDLYSPAALRLPVERRVHTARELAAELRAMMAMLPSMDIYRLPKASQEKKYDAAVLDMLMKSDRVSMLSSLALCYRAIPPDGCGMDGDGISRTFNQECIEVAREAMQAHAGCMQLMRESRDLATAYIHWTILYSPFIPFIVIFCHIIETSNLDDLARLTEFVKSLEVGRDMSEPVGKLHRLCNALVNVATMYLETKKQQKAATQAEDGATTYPVNMEFDMYFRDLGFMPPQPSVHPQQQPGPSVLQQQPQQPGLGYEFGNAQLGDWFSGNLSMMGMLERDLSQFNPESWAQGTAAPVAGPGQVPGQHQMLLLWYSVDRRKGRLEARLLEPTLLEPAGTGATVFAANLDADDAIRFCLCFSRTRCGSRVAHHGLHVLEALLVRVVI
ncbi:uncharacterized protein PpBr36_09960 [Pyricularia pennisetigena]|uniref:uncharacterized protein n=1 Tax=Pyricularia pennisetigena TaxID=1578925 RepID=UPI00114E208B|nr:uncharacterized protein PpBr36_09960 [Pyricularia pennisetigena]TLS22160.1 hypothetical protein PpBr36_09960 [Pyricularia pennisetigena]